MSEPRRARRRIPSGTRPGALSRFARRAVVGILLLTIGCLSGAASLAADITPGPRIINFYNFIRNSDYRLAHSEEILFDCTRRQIELFKRAGLPATWALQYDALINPRYPKLLKAQLGTNDEIAAWWEIPQPLAEKAGLKWRGRHEWDPAANVGFSPGYTPDERRKLADVYMADFKAIFGYYPRTVGSWYIDEVTLAYLAERYGIVASCNCKDQIGTDSYTLWGGYWNQAYYPSRLNAFMPAQTRSGQIDVPIFRMSGSDPIYQHGVTPGMFTLETVYPDAGGSSNWVSWFVGNLVHEPPLAFAYAQAGQENSFGWAAMQCGLEQQVHLLLELARSGVIRVETLAQSGQWYRSQFPVTPCTAVVALDDWKHQNRRTVWYDSRYYRLNVFWEGDAFFIRDLHYFNEKVISPTHEMATTATGLFYETLPVMDWARWSKSGTAGVGMWPVRLASDGTAVPMTPAGVPVVRSLAPQELQIQQPLQGGGRFVMNCAENQVYGNAVDGDGKPLRWAWKLVGGEHQSSAVQSVTPTAVYYRYAGTDYKVQLPAGSGSCRQMKNGDIELAANPAGSLVLQLGESAH